MNESIPDDKLRRLLNVIVNTWFAKWASRAGKLTEQEWDACFAEAVTISEQGVQYPIVIKLLRAFLEELDARWRGGSYPEYDSGYREEDQDGAYHNMST